MNPVTFTDAALKYLREQMIKQKNTHGFYLSIKKTGCSGFAYHPNFVEIPPENAIHYLAQDGLPIYIDQKSETILNGVIVDLTIDKLSKRLTYFNPNEKNRCGCGESFIV